MGSPDTKSRFQKVVVKTLGHIQSTAEQYADSVPAEQGSKRRLAAVTAASIISASLDRASEVTTDEEDGPFPPGMTQEEKRIAKQNHFIDILLEKLLVNAIPDNLPNKGEFQFRINDPMRKESEKLSVSKFTSNLTQLTTKIGGIFQAQYFILRIFSWAEPSLTLTYLIVYTILILHPHLLIISPLLYLLYGAMLPGYLYRHPIRNYLPSIIPTKDRGDSLIEKFARVKDNKKLDAMLYTDDEFNERVPEVDESVDTSTNLLKTQMEFLINMRDLQNSMTGMLKLSNKLEDFWYGTAGFKDERVSTSLFFTVLLTTISSMLIDPLINWRLVFIVLGWLLLIAIHPKVLPHLKNAHEVLVKPHNLKFSKMVKESERNDIIIDESPEIREIEVFEIQDKSSSIWSFYLYSNNIFDLTDEYRRAQKPPPGVMSLDDVGCPKTWRFHDSQWSIDYDCEKWVKDRGLRLNGMNIDEKNEFLIDEQFRRRRLFRNVIRYSKPARKPPHLL